MKVINKVIERIRTYGIDKSYVEAHQKHSLDHQEEYRLVDDIVSKFRATGGLKFEHQAYKLWSLYKLLQEHQPNSILEFGSGSSSLIFCDYVRKNDCTFLSIDEDEKWANNTSKLIGIKESDHIEIKQADKVVYPNLPTVEIKYDTHIAGNYDFALIDGPSLHVSNTKLKEAINSNFRDLSELPKLILVDVRKATAEYIAKHYGDIYDYKLSDIFTREKVQPGYQYFSVFVKK